MKIQTTTMTTRKSRGLFAQETPLFAHVFINSGRAVFIHISRVFACVSCVSCVVWFCFGGRKLLNGSEWLNSKLLSIWNSSGITPKGPLGPWAPKAPLGPGVRRRRTYAPCRGVYRASVDEVCARCDVAENVVANKLGLYMGTGEQKLTLYINIPPHRNERFRTLFAFSGFLWQS